MPDNLNVQALEMLDANVLANLPLGQLSSFGEATKSTAFSKMVAGPGGTDDPPKYSKITLNGRFVLKIDVGWGITSNVPAWSWTVRALRKQGNTWRHRGSTMAGADGAFSLKLSPYTDPSLPVVIEYQAANRLVRFVDPNKVTYSWSATRDVVNGVNTIGTYATDMTVNGDLPGLYMLMSASNQLWRKFTTNGMNPLRSDPIRILYPNNMSTGECQYKNEAGDTYAWSCSYSSDGNIALLPEHAKSFVVQHEIAHSIHSYFWKGQIPSGSGIPYAADTCYNNGLGLTEGFANFVPHWVQFDRSNPAPQLDGFNTDLEEVPSSVCNGSENETRVAAMLWDAHDSHVDGASETDIDNIYFNHQGAVIFIFLSNATATSALDFFNIYKDIAGNDRYYVLLHVPPQHTALTSSD